MDASEELTVQVEIVRTYLMAQHCVVVLRTVRGDGYLTIRLSIAEAQALRRAFRGQNGVQDLALQLIAPLGGRIERVVIRSLAEEGSYATLTLAQDEQRRDVNAHVDEALMLA